jgi:hypothetical protein
MKQLRAYKTNLKQSQDEIKLSPKLTPKNKRDKTRVQQKKGGHLQRQSNLASMGNKASMKVSSLDMP